MDIKIPDPDDGPTVLMAERFVPLDSLMGDSREARMISQYAVQQVVDEVVALFVGEKGLCSFDLSIDVRGRRDDEPLGFMVTGSVILQSD